MNPANKALLKTYLEDLRDDADVSLNLTLDAIEELIDTEVAVEHDPVEELRRHRASGAEI